MKRLTALVLALLMMALALTACTSEQAPAASDTPAATETPADDAGEQPAGTEGAESADGETLAADQTLRVSIGVDLTDLSPLTETTTEGSEMLLTVLDTLVRQGENGTIEEGSGLAESWDVSEDGKTYTFHLRDAVFSNGDPIRAQDFEYTWKKASPRRPPRSTPTCSTPSRARRPTTPARAPWTTWPSTPSTTRPWK